MADKPTSLGDDTEVGYPVVITQARYSNHWYAFPQWLRSIQDHPTQLSDNDCDDFLNYENSVGRQLMGSGVSPDAALISMYARIQAYGDIWSEDLNDWHRSLPDADASDPAPDGTEWVLADEGFVASTHKAVQAWFEQPKPTNPTEGMRHLQAIARLNPLPVPEIKPGMWVEFDGAKHYLIQELKSGESRDSFVSIFFNGFYWVPIRLDSDGLVPCDPSENAGRLYQLLGIEGEAS